MMIVLQGSRSDEAVATAQAHLAANDLEGDVYFEDELHEDSWPLNITSVQMPGEHDHLTLRDGSTMTFGNHGTHPIDNVDWFLPLGRPQPRSGAPELTKAQQRRVLKKGGSW